MPDLAVRREDGRTVLLLPAPLDLRAASALWRPAVRAARRARGHPLLLRLPEGAGTDAAGLALLAALLEAHGAAELEGAPAALRERLRPGARRPAAPPPAADRVPLLASLPGRVAERVAFLGEVAVASARLLRRPGALRWADAARLADTAGASALPLVLLLGFLIGLILAFQSAIPLARFGAQIFVANLVVTALLREMGPLLAAVVLAGRTGSAFAAELGTMAVNEELAALRTMGLDPVGVLVLPRMLAAVLVMPALTMAFELSGLLGAVAVLRGLGFPIAAVLAQARGAAHVSDLVGGLVKATCFGALVAFVGCRAGVNASAGPRAVGEAATAAVVGGIVGSIVLDGVFALLFFRLGL